jgi:glycosyltransferase involved in cell wall biosynthesis
MRLEFVISEMGIGGAERVVVDLALDAVARGDELLLLGAPGRNDEHLAGRGIGRVSLPTGRTPLDLARSTGRTARATRRFRPALVHAHNVKMTAVARAGSRLAGLRRPPLLTTYHGVPHEEVDAAARILRLADLVACVSEDLIEQLAGRGVPAERLAVVPNGVPDPDPATTTEAAMRALDAELGLMAESPVVSVVGRLVPQKAHDRFLRAAQIVHASIPAAKFLIVGDGVGFADVQRRVHAMDLDGHVVMTGFRRDIPEIMAALDVLVLPSVRSEATSQVIPQALAVGTPVVATAVGGIPELVTDDVTGRLVPPNSPAVLAGAIVDIISDPERARAMAQAGQAMVFERFTVDAMMAATTQVYRELVR